MRSRSYTPFLIVLLLLATVIFFAWRQFRLKHLRGEIQLYDPRCAMLSDEWSHVYRPERLEVVGPCRGATGTVTHVRSEPDGDIHISLALDAGQDDLLNGENTSRQHGNLVVELICAHSVTQEDAIAACTGWQNQWQVRRGQHLFVVGAYVLDRDHGWMEMHPVSELQELP